MKIEPGKPMPSECPTPQTCLDSRTCRVGTGCSGSGIKLDCPTPASMSSLLPKVLNLRCDVIPSNAVYVGRPTKWGNPFVIGKDGNREEVIAKYKIHAQSFDRAELKAALRGRDLVCWCAPKACHADVLLEVVGRL